MRGGHGGSYYICMYVYIYIYIHNQTCIYDIIYNVYTRIIDCASIYQSLSLSLYIYIYIYTYVCVYVYVYIYIYVCMCVYIYICICICIYIYIPTHICVYVYTYIISYLLPRFPHPPPLSRPRYDIFSWAVHVDRPYGALNMFHTGGSVVGVGVVILVLSILTSEPGRFHDDSQNRRSLTGSAPTAVHTRTSEPPFRFKAFHRLEDVSG